MTDSAFQPPWWLRGGHAQTLYPRLVGAPDIGPGRPQRLHTDDGDFIDLAWFGPDDGATVLLLHGLEGSLQSQYAGLLIDVLSRRGFRCVFMHFRGCSGEPNRLARSYHSGETGDPAWVVGTLGRQGIRVDAAVGVSLGGNVLLKWLGETGAAAPFAAAAAISVPFELDACARRLERGLSRVYQRHLLASLRAKYRDKFSRIASPLAVDVDRLTTFRRFDDQVTAPLHGFAGVDEYYRRSSSRQFIRQIEVPTLILHSADDPFMVPDAIPTAMELAPAVVLELSSGGGHVGFVGGQWPWRPEFWLGARVADWLGDTLAVTSRPTTDPTAAEIRPAQAPSP